MLEHSGKPYRRLLRDDLGADDRYAIGKLIDGCEAHLRTLDPVAAEALERRRSVLGKPSGAPAAADAVPERDMLEQRLWALLEGCAESRSTAEAQRATDALLHEISQPLTAIRYYVAGCRHLVRSEDAGPLDDALRHIAEQAERIWQIAQKMRESAI